MNQFEMSLVLFVFNSSRHQQLKSGLRLLQIFKDLIFLAHLLLKFRISYLVLLNV